MLMQKKDEKWQLSFKTIEVLFSEERTDTGSRTSGITVVVVVVDPTPPLQIHIYPQTDECVLEIDKKITQQVFARVCRELG